MRLSSVCMIVCALLVLMCFLGSAEAKPSCDSCMKAGFPYLCKGSISDGKCFQNAGDVTCDGDGCICCKKQASSGCQSCEDDDEPDDDDEE